MSGKQFDFVLLLSFPVTFKQGMFLLHGGCPLADFLPPPHSHFLPTDQLHSIRYFFNIVSSLESINLLYSLCLDLFSFFLTEVCIRS